MSLLSSEFFNDSPSAVVQNLNSFHNVCGLLSLNAGTLFLLSTVILGLGESLQEQRPHFPGSLVAGCGQVTKEGVIKV